MESRPLLKIGLYSAQVSPTHDIFNGSEVSYSLSRKSFTAGRLAITLTDYLVKHTKRFDKVSHYIITSQSVYLKNGTWTGIIGYINRSELDIGAHPITMTEKTKEVVDFAYPFKLHYEKFVTRKIKYIPQTFGILQTFPLSMWTAIFTALIVASIISYVLFKRRYQFNKVSLHVFGVLLRQSSILTPSSVAENLLVYTWVVGAMIICLAYESTFLSFLAIPPVNEIKDTSQLAKAVINGKYHCVAHDAMLVSRQLLKSKLKDLQIIGEDMRKNNLVPRDFFIDLFLEIRGKGEKNLALLAQDSQTSLFEDLGYILEDRVNEQIGAMTVRKDFCCKKMLDTFVHRLMASGLYFKFDSDCLFLGRLSTLLDFRKEDLSRRKLTLTDVAPAFIFLLFGYVLSFLVFLGEIAFRRKNKMKYLTKKKQKRRKSERKFNEDFV